MQLKTPCKLVDLDMMKRLIICFVSLAIILAGGCSSGGWKVTPLERAELHNRCVVTKDPGSAYTMLSARLKNKYSLEQYKLLLDSGKNFEENEELLQSVQFSFTREVVNGNKATVYGFIDVAGRTGEFRTRLIFENRQWMIDTDILEDKLSKFEEFYRNSELFEAADKYSVHLSRGEVEDLWVMTSKKIRGSMSFDRFKDETIKTGSGKSPQEEGFNISTLSAYSDDAGNGFGFIRIASNRVANQEYQEGVVFKMPFVFENDEWKADFSRIEESYKTVVPESQ
jgi:hypothetical protein